MGGNALKQPSVRLTKKSYALLAANCVAKLRLLYPNARVQDIASYRLKTDFGDLDVVLDAADYDPLEAAKALDAVEIVRSGTVTSMGIKVRPEIALLDGNVFQADLIKLDSEKFEFGLGYFSYNDLGSLIGRIARKMGLKFGHDGLWLPVRDGDYLCGQVLLTQDFERAVTFLGFDYARWKDGFDNLEDIFRYVSTGKRFSRNLYLLEHANH